MIVPGLLFMAMAGLSGRCPPKPPQGMVARSAQFGGVIAPTSADADEGVAAGIAARRAARRYLGIDVPPFLIAMPSPDTSVSPSGCAFLFPWPFVRRDVNAPRPPSHVLPHEIGHALFIRFLVPKTGIDEYGGDAPDWLDEMAALAFEDPAGVRLRRADTRRHAARNALIPLARLLSMPHPEWRARQITPDAQSEPLMAQPASVDTPAFYATVRALLDFLLDRTGNQRIIRVLAERVRAGAPVDRWLLVHATRSGPEEGLAGLDAEIKSFVLTDPAYEGRPRVADAGTR